MTNTPDDLSALIHQAETAVSGKRQQAREVAARSEPGARRSLAKPLFATVMAGLVGWSGYAVWKAMAPPSASQVEHDLENVVDAAQKSIEQAKADTGEYPDALPNAALASVVRYERDAVKSGYTLSATVMGIRVTLEPSGRKTTEKGITE